MDLGLKGKVAFVAAASQGLGRAVADELAAEGASLILNSRNAEKISKIANEISNKTGSDTCAAAGDLSKTNELEHAVSAGS